MPARRSETPKAEKPKTQPTCDRSLPISTAEKEKHSQMLFALQETLIDFANEHSYPFPYSWAQEAASMLTGLLLPPSNQPLGEITRGDLKVWRPNWASLSTQAEPQT